VYKHKQRQRKETMSRRRGSGSIYQLPGCKTWTIQFYRDHRIVREATGLTDYQAARQQLNRRLNEVTEGTYIPPKLARTRVDELGELILRDYRINKHKSLDDLQARWELHLKPFFGHLRAMDVTSTLIDRYVDERLTQTSRSGEKTKNATINREMAALKRMFRLGYYATPPLVTRLPRFPKLEENNVREGFAEDGQCERIIEYCPELWFRGLVECGRTYGWRESELLNLRVKQIDMMQRVIRLAPGTTKNKSGRNVAMTAAVAGLLGALVEGKGPDDFLFTRPDGKPVRSFKKLWRNACISAEVPALLFHDLRRTRARDMRRAGISEEEIMKIGGWKTASVFKRYAIVDESDMRAAMGKLERKREQDRLERGRIAPDAIDHDFDHDSAISSAAGSKTKTARIN
jgi:integrase